MHTIYFFESNSKTEAWRYNINNINLIAGMIAGSIGILDDYNFIINDNYKTQKREYHLGTNLDISTYRLLKDVPEDEIDLYTEIKPGFYGLWIKSNIPYHYNLYTYDKDDFFQGVLNIANILNVDFRSYIKGYPFDYKGQLYINPNVKELAMYVPDRQYEIEEEERGNENVIELLRKEH